MKVELKDILHLYLGCPAVIKRLIHPKAEIKDKVTPSSLTMMGDKTILIKPILRPLSDITEQEKKALKMVMRDAVYGENLLPPISSGNLTNLYINKEDPKIILWLLKQGFDLFGLIESGQVINKNKL